MIELEDIFTISNELVAKKIEAEIIIVPINAGVGDLNAELYSLNETGSKIWQKLDGKNTVRQIIDELAASYTASYDEIKKDVFHLLDELYEKKMISKK